MQVVRTHRSPVGSKVLAVGTLFTHVPSGARIALPIGERWVINPADPRIVACGAFHGVLQAP
ncbi:MAG: hypothetical protein IPO88_20240 [Nannocystis sp.]|uniref:hypothetical protein n=1 Tax=Nannocystis sp. TaxID=1962667 RepID=UPI002424A6BA|nr:hypothetical protein [Nannocystis sp.]MBK9755791.1 hypothetical protein [Nannocystis sp.]